MILKPERVKNIDLLDWHEHLMSCAQVIMFWMEVNDYFSSEFSCNDFRK